MSLMIRLKSVAVRRDVWNTATSIDFGEENTTGVELGRFSQT